MLGITAGFAVDFVVHLAHAYAQKPHCPREQRVREAFAECGGSVFSGMLTSIIAGLAMLMCDISMFYQFGVFLILLMLFSWFSGNFLFMGILGIIGPEDKAEIDMHALHLPHLHMPHLHMPGSHSHSSPQNEAQISVGVVSAEEATAPVVSAADVEIEMPPPAAAADKADAAAARDAIVPTPAGPTHDQRKATIDRYNSKQERRAGGGVELTAEA